MSVSKCTMKLNGEVETMNDAIAYCKTIEGFLKEEQGLYLHEIAAALPDKAVIVEIGSYLGRSSCFIASALAGSRKNFFAVDTFENDAMREGKRDTLAIFSANTAPYSQYITVIRGRSGEVVKTFTKTIDMLFIDGDHSYEGCLSDLEAWLPLVKPEGLILFHDYYTRSPAKRVKVVVDQFCRDGKLHFVEEVKAMAVTRKT